MPHCLNCDSFVTDHYVRVFSHEGEDGVRHCPDCEKIWDGHQVRTMRSPAGEPVDTPHEDGGQIATDGGSDS
jgi:hypothetical protein